MCAVLPVGIFVYLLGQSTGNSFRVQFYQWVSLYTFSVYWKQFLRAVLPVGIFVYLLSQSSGNSFCAQFYQWVSLSAFSVGLLETVLYFSFSKEKWTPNFHYEDYEEDALLVEFMYFVFTCMPGESYHG